MSTLANQHCQAYRNTPPMDPNTANQHLSQTNKWLIDDAHTSIYKSFKFENYYQTTAFLNAVIWIAHEQDHHPDIEFSYNKCKISFSTHSIGGLSLNDFICAARIDTLEK